MSRWRLSLVLLASPLLMGFGLCSSSSSVVDAAGLDDSGKAASSLHAVISNLSADANTTDVFDSVSTIAQMQAGNPGSLFWQGGDASYPAVGRTIEIMLPGQPTSGVSFPLGDYTNHGAQPIALVTLIDGRGLDPTHPSYTKTWCTGAGVSGMSSGGSVLIESVAGKRVVIRGYGANLGNCASGLARGTFSISEFRAEADVDGL